MRLPDFIIIGAAKSGTTTLYKYLCKHPQVYMGPGKEPAFFAFDENYSQGIEWYTSLFSAAQPNQICGEASTDYTKYPQFPETPARIAQTLPQVKMIYIMRNPVERAYSYYIQITRGQKIQETFEEQIKRTSICLDASFYMMQIERYLQFFPRASFLFLLMEELIDNPAATMEKVCTFIGVETQINLTEEGKITANSRNNWFEKNIRAKITAPLKAIPGVKQVAYLLPQESRNWVYNKLLKGSLYGNAIKKQYLPPPMLPETRQMLLEKFKQPNEKLAEFLGRDLSHWSK